MNRSKQASCLLQLRRGTQESGFVAIRLLLRPQNSTQSRCGTATQLNWASEPEKRELEALCLDRPHPMKRQCAFYIATFSLRGLASLPRIVNSPFSGAVLQSCVDSELLQRLRPTYSGYKFQRNFAQTNAHFFQPPWQRS